MRNEIEALEENETCRITYLPPEKRHMGCKWVYKIKYNSDETFERYKTRLVVQSSLKRKGLDYYKTFSPVIKIINIWLLLSLVVVKGWHLK